MRLSLVLCLALLSGCVSTLAASRAADVAAGQHNCPRDRVRVISDAGSWSYWLDVCGRRRLYQLRNGQGHDVQDVTDSVSH